MKKNFIIFSFFLINTVFGSYRSTERRAASVNLFSWIEDVSNSTHNTYALVEYLSNHSVNNSLRNCCGKCPRAFALSLGLTVIDDLLEKYGYDLLEDAPVRVYRRCRMRGAMFIGFS